MLTPGSRTTLVIALVAVAVGGAGTEARGQHNRRTPIVEAVEKTRASIVTVKAEKRSNWGRKEMVGTGVIVDERGYVVTNYHVAAAAERVVVCLADGTQLSAQVLHEDPRHDLAVVRIHSTTSLRALPLGPGSDLLVGETVIAVGHPFGYTNSVSTGIVSAVGREITVGGETLGNLIQTNASINPGNSGGPLLNINGELIGINVAVREGAQGIAFALNADTVQQVLSQHLSAEKLAGVRHGLSCRESVADEGSARQHLIVEGVARASQAAAAGLHPGDGLVKVAGRCLSNRFDLERALWDHKSGERIAVTVQRQGQELQLTLTLAPLKEHARVAAAGSR